MSDFLFIYGTLVPELAPKDIAPVVRKLELIGSGSVPGTLYDLGDFPGIKLERASRKRVRGRVFRIPSKATLKVLDDYEEFDPKHPRSSLYKRKLVNVKLDNGETIRSWIYEYNRSPRPKNVIKNGMYSPVFG
jgi:gamma-glutamylcyclotransferase (GGCT)/AIG2-like uncharacterized protein YtfP